MKKLKGFMTILFACSLMLMACNDDNESTDENNAEEPLEQEEQEDINNDHNPDTDTEEADAETGSKENDDGEFEISTEDQLDLKLGDTGTFETTLGTYEMTLDDAELIGNELDGVKTMLDELILLDITVKNIGDTTLNIEDAIESMHISDSKDGSGFYDGAEDFESVEKFTGELEPGEEKSGQFISDVSRSDQYFFRKDSGNITAGSSNQVMWTFELEAAE